MRFLLKVNIDTEAGNAAAKAGKLNESLQAILADLKPEAAYFLAERGKRTAYIFLDVQDLSQIPSIAEPFFLACKAEIDLIPVMVPQDLAKAEKSIAEVAKKYG